MESLLPFPMNTVRPALVLPLLALLSACGGQHQAVHHPERFLHTATLLADGRVLVSGGSNSHGALRDASLYDPVSGVWSSTGSLTRLREGHTATLLITGDVLVVGGGGDTLDKTSGAEVYSTSTGTWSVVSQASDNRVDHAAVRLRDGRVLVMGGTLEMFNTDERTLDSALLFEPDGKSWNPTGSMHHPRSQFTATLLDDGRVLALGGLPGNGGGIQNSAELYDPATGAWTEIAPMPVFTHFDHQATRLSDGRVLVITQLLANALLYTPAPAPATGSWRTVTSPSLSRIGASLVSVGDKALLLGGRPESSSLTGDPRVTEVYSPSAGWSSKAPLAEGRWDATATVLGSGKVLVVGGTSTEQPADGFAPYLATAELYDPVSDPDHGTWTSAGSLP